MPITRRHRSGNQRGAQIGFVCVSRSLVTKSYSANGKRYGNSDHSPVHCSILGRKIKLRRVQSKNLLTGWRPRPEGQSCSFRRLVLQESGLQGDPTDLSRGAAIRGISDATECAAKQIEYTTRRSRSREADSKPEDLREAEQLAKSLPPGPERRAARNKERKLRRRWKTKQVAQFGRRTVRNVPNNIMFDGRLAADRTKWVKGVRDHCWEKYYDTRRTAEQQWRTVSMLRACMKAVILDGWKAPVLTFDVVLRARTLFQSNKVGGGKDEIVYEMIQGLPLCVVSVLWRLFDARYKGEVYEDMKSWRWLLLI